MTISYTVTRKSATTGLSRSYAHRHPLKRILIPLGGVLFTMGSLFWFRTNDDPTKWMPGVWMLFAALIYFFLPMMRNRNSVKNMFAGRTGDLTVEMIPVDEGMGIKTPGSSGAASWESFFDFKICEDGILLYPQKNMHFWIPATATIEGGSWEDFGKIVSERITRKI